MKKLLIGLLLALFVAPAFAQSPVALCYTSNGKNCTPAIQSSASVKISTSTGTTTELVPLIALKQVFVTSFDLVATAANTAKFVYGTGTACGTGTADLTGAYGLTTFSVVTKGDGMGPILVVPAGNALCITTTTTGQLSGSVSYTQF